MSEGWVRKIGAYFDEAAPRYASDMESVFGPLAHGLIDLGNLQAGELVIDIGTGTGAAVRAVQKITSHIIGLDISKQMLEQARTGTTAPLARCDTHELPIQDNSVDVVIAAFALNSTDPTIALAEVHRILRPQGRLLVQEWDAEDPISEIVSDTFASYAVDDPPDHLAAFRTQMGMHLPWDDVESIDELVGLLKKENFRILEEKRETPTIPFGNVRQFLAYKLAWPTRTRELEVMPSDLRALCLSDLLENMESFAETNGNLLWKPNVFRIIAEA